MKESRHISRDPKTHQEPIVLVDHKPIQATFKKTPQEKGELSAVRHVMKRIKVEGKSQPSQAEKRSRKTLKLSQA
jgi:hypothetical protein